MTILKQFITSLIKHTLYDIVEFCKIRVVLFIQIVCIAFKQSTLVYGYKGEKGKSCILLSLYFMHINQMACLMTILMIINTEFA